MVSQQTVTDWIDQARAGDGRALQLLWERYFGRLVGLARKRLEGRGRTGPGGSEDVAAEVFASFWRGLENGGRPSLLDRDHLWNLLARITVFKAAKLLERERAEKRGGGAVRGDSAFAAPEESGGGLDQVLDQQPTPELAAQAAEEVQRLLGILDDELRTLALLKAEGHTNEQAAARLGWSVSKVQRGLKLIRRMWEKEWGE